MKRVLGLILVLVLVCGVCGVRGETAGNTAAGQKAPDFILEGFDGEGSTRVWETNLFFERMEKKTGISFQFREYTAYTRWSERKKAILQKED